LLSTPTKKNKNGNNRQNKKELLERIMGNFKSIMYSSLYITNELPLSLIIGLELYDMYVEPHTHTS